jgi:aspartate/methionine/tyrosine aminotransferase
MSDSVSPTLLCKLIVNERIQNKETVYNFGLGENPIKQPSYFIDSVKRHAHEKSYTSCEGIPELNQTLRNIYDTDDTSYEILVGNGLKELLFVIQSAFDGTIIHITPSWVSYKEQIDVLGKNDKLIEIETKLEDGFKINHDVLNKTLESLGNQPKIVLFNNPNNPAGICFDNDEVECLARILQKYDCMVFADEIYLNLCMQSGHKSIAEYIPDLTIRGSSVSKDLACGGYRLGWLAFPRKLDTFFNRCRLFSSQIYSCAASPIQYATNDILQNAEVCANHANNTIKLFSGIFDEMLPILDETRLCFVKPNAAWYVFIDFENYRTFFESIGVRDSIDLSTHLLSKFGIVTVAAQHFQHNSFSLRFSLVDFTFDFENGSSVDISHMKKGFCILRDYLTTFV